jgi:hypothetical protein
MRRFFFDLIDKGRIITDAEGQEFAVAEEAKAHAVHVAAELGRNKEGDESWISVRTDAGMEIFRVPLWSQKA